VRGRQRLSRGDRKSSGLAQILRASEWLLTTGMRIVLISDLVNRNKVVIAFIILELRGTNTRLVDVRIEDGVDTKYDVARERTVVHVAESGNVYNIWTMLRLKRRTGQRLPGVFDSNRDVRWGGDFRDQDAKKSRGGNGLRPKVIIRLTLSVPTVTGLYRKLH
jgi:hypothetical protein